MNTKTFHLSGVDRAIYAAATTKFHEAQAPIHKAIMDKVRAALAAQEAEVLAKHRDALSILDLPCYTIQDGKVVEGTVSDHLRLFPQVTYTEPELSADAFSPELVLRHNIQAGVYEIVYLGEGTETLIAHATTIEALRPVYDSHLLQGILDNPRANIFWVREHAEAACAQHAAPVVLPEPVSARYRPLGGTGLGWTPCYLEFARSLAGGVYELEYLFAEQQVRELLAKPQGIDTPRRVT